ncbi:MAG: hypothetical protein ACJ74W_19765 [Pyrinomonadaceae bacterium]
MYLFIEASPKFVMNEEQAQLLPQPGGTMQYFFGAVGYTTRGH